MNETTIQRIEDCPVIERENLIFEEASRILSAVERTLPPINCSETEELNVERKLNGIYVTTNNIKFRATGLTTDNLHRMKVALASTWADREEAPFIHTLDLYRSDQIEHYCNEAFKAINIKPSLLKREIRKVTAVLDKERYRLIENKPPDTASELSLTEQQEARQYLQNPNLLEWLSENLKTLGVVGEKQNALLLYLIGTSRLALSPLGAVITAPLASGKSHLLNTVLSAFPSESSYNLHHISSKLLRKKGRHFERKIMSFDSVKLHECEDLVGKLINDQKVASELWSSDPHLGRLFSECLTEECHTAIAITTTDPNKVAPVIRQSLLNLTLDTSHEQTKRILLAQLEDYSSISLDRATKREEVRRVLQNAQRLLKPRIVLIPEEITIELPTGDMGRRSLRLLISLAQSIALLHQYQRPITKGVLYIEKQDLETAIELTRNSLPCSMVEISLPAQRLLRTIQNLVQDKMSAIEDIEQAMIDIEFTRGEIRPLIGWSESYLRLVLKELQRHEYISRITGGQGSEYRYALLDSTIDIAEHRGHFAVKVRD